MKRAIVLALLFAGTAAIAQTAHQSGVDKSLIDTAVKPGDGFNAYSNGEWLKTAEIPADQSNLWPLSSIRCSTRSMSAVHSARDPPKTKLFQSPSHAAKRSRTAACTRLSVASTRGLAGGPA